MEGNYGQTDGQANYEEKPGSKIHLLLYNARLIGLQKIRNFGPAKRIGG